MSLLRAIGSGLVGAAAVTLLNEGGRQVIPHAPRMDVIGMRGVRRPMEALGYDPPRGRTLRKVSLGGDIVSNGLYYGLVAVGDRRHVWRRGIVLGVLAGLGAALLPPVIGLGDQPHRRTPWTQLLTVAWYTLAGVAAAGAANAVESGE